MSRSYDASSALPGRPGARRGRLRRRQEPEDADGGRPRVERGLQPRRRRGRGGALRTEDPVRRGGLPDRAAHARAGARLPPGDGLVRPDRQAPRARRRGRSPVLTRVSSERPLRARRPRARFGLLPRSQRKDRLLRPDRRIARRKLHSVETRRWPRRNDPDSIRARQEALGLDGEVTAHDLAPFAGAQESLTGVAVTPVSVVGPLRISLGKYELTEPEGRVEERGRAEEDVFVPLAHTEGGLSDSLYRGARAAAESGGLRTFVLADRITRASCFVCRDTEDAVTLARWIEGELDAARTWLEELDHPARSRFAKLREVKTHVVGPMCHVLWRWTTGDAVGANMMTRNAYLLNMGFVMERAPVRPERAILEANMGGDKKPSFQYFQSGHGKTVLAEATLTED